MDKTTGEKLTQEERTGLGNMLVREVGDAYGEGFRHGANFKQREVDSRDDVIEKLRDNLDVQTEECQGWEARYGTLMAKLAVALGEEPTTSEFHLLRLVKELRERTGETGAPLTTGALVG